MSIEFLTILKKNKYLTYSVIGSLLFASSALGVQRTALAIYASEFGGNYNQYVIVAAAISLAVFGGSKAIGNFFGGRFADSRGRDFTSRLGLIILAMGSILLVLANSLEIFIIGNSIVGFGIGLLFAASAITFTDIATVKHRAKGISLMELSVYLGTSFGAIIAGKVAHSWDFETTFLVALIITTFGLLWGFGLKDTRSFVKEEEVPIYLTAKEKLIRINKQWIQHLKENDVEKDFRDIYAPLLDKAEDNKEIHQTFSKKIFLQLSFLLTLTTGIVSRISDSAMILIFPLLILEYGFSPVQLGFATSIFTLFWSIGIAITGPFSDSVGKIIPLTIGLFMEALGLVIIFLLQLNKWFPFVIFGSMVAGFGRGIYFPIPPTCAIDFVPPKYRGITLGIYRFVLDFGYVIGAVLLVILIEPRAKEGLDNIALLEPVMIVVIIILAIQGLLIVVFLKDPRPSFKQFPQVKTHLELVSQSINNISSGIIYFTENKVAKAQEKLQKAKSFEQEADKVLEFMTQATYSGVWKATDALEILQFSAKVDKSIGFAIRAVRKLLMVDVDLPKNFMIKLSQYAIILDILIETTFETFELLPIRMNLAVEQSYQVNYVEEYLDEIHRQLWQEIIGMTEIVTPMSLLLLSQAIDSLESGANILEDAAELIRLISFKH